MVDFTTELITPGVCTFALNHGNVILVNGMSADGTARGITPDLAAMIARKLGLEPRFVHYNRAVEVTEAALRNEWDVCFLAIDPKRAEIINFTDPYIQISGAYLARNLDSPEAVDVAGHAVAATRGSAYALFLERHLRNAELRLYETFDETIEALRAGTVAAVGGVLQAVEKHDNDTLKVVEPPFMTINQAVGARHAAPLLSARLMSCVADLNTNSEIQKLLVSHGVD